jgi:hypothetical protein
MELCNDDYIITSLLRKSCYFHWLCDDSVVVLAATFVHLLIKAGMSIFTPNKPLALPGQPYSPRRPKFFYWSTSATGHLPLSLLVYLCTGRSLGRGLSTSSKKLCLHASRAAATFCPFVDEHKSIVNDVFDSHSLLVVLLLSALHCQ